MTADRTTEQAVAAAVAAAVEVRTALAEDATAAG